MEVLWNSHPQYPKACLQQAAACTGLQYLKALPLNTVIHCEALMTGQSRQAHIPPPSKKLAKTAEPQAS